MPTHRCASAESSRFDSFTYRMFEYLPRAGEIEIWHGPRGVVIPPV
jgi:hypothetical protein